MNELKNLLSVKKIIALALTFTFIFLTIAGKDVSDPFKTLYGMIIAFYFGQSTARETQSNSKKNDDISKENYSASEENNNILK